MPEIMSAIIKPLSPFARTELPTAAQFHARRRTGAVDRCPLHNQAMSFGVPLVSAGLTEDKADVNVRVGWSEVGINLETDKPTGRCCAMPFGPARY